MIGQIQNRMPDVFYIIDSSMNEREYRLEDYPDMLYEVMEDLPSGVLSRCKNQDCCRG